jgi:hypothetical protein
MSLQKLTPECISRNRGFTEKTFAISNKYKTFDFNWTLGFCYQVQLVGVNVQVCYLKLKL